MATSDDETGASMNTPPHDLLDSPPFWQVQSVFDPDGTGKDFAYTIGMHTRGLPELHIWARPSLGQDPGHDWKLSANDRCRVLNDLSGMLVDGRLTVGSQVTREYDAGQATVTFRVEPPGDPERLEAYGVPPGVDVLPVLWSLQRPAEGTLTGPTPAAEEQARATYATLVANLDRTRRAPRGWELPTDPAFGADQQFGPLTSLVVARAAELWQADDAALTRLLDVAAAVDPWCSLSSATSLAIAAARPAGRRSSLESLHQATHVLVSELTDAPAARQPWRRIGRRWDENMWRGLDSPARHRVHRNLTRILHDLTVSALMVEAVADVAAGSLLLEARGPWASALHDQYVLTDPAWQAAPEVLAVVRELLEGLDLQGVASVAERHVVAVEEQTSGVSAYAEVCSRLEAWALVSAAACPWEPVLADLPAWRPLLGALPDLRIAAIPELHRWATCLTSALTHRARLSADDVDAFVAPHLSALSGLAEVVNAPVVSTLSPGAGGVGW
jgi:hypothetical protein